MCGRKSRGTWTLAKKAVPVGLRGAMLRCSEVVPPPPWICLWSYLLRQPPPPIHSLPTPTSGHFTPCPTHTLGLDPTPDPPPLTNGRLLWRLIAHCAQPDGRLPATTATRLFLLFSHGWGGWQCLYQNCTASHRRAVNSKMIDSPRFHDSYWKSKSSGLLLTRCFRPRRARLRTPVVPFDSCMITQLVDHVLCW